MKPNDPLLLINKRIDLVPLVLQNLDRSWMRLVLSCRLAVEVYP